MALRDLIARVILKVDRAAVEAASAEIRESLKAGTQPDEAVANIGKVEQSIDDLAKKAESFDLMSKLADDTKAAAATAGIEKIDAAIDDATASAKELGPALAAGTSPAQPIEHVQRIETAIDKLAGEAKQVAPALAAGTAPEKPVENVHRVEDAVEDVRDEAKKLGPELDRGTDPRKPVENLRDIEGGVDRLWSKIRQAASALGLFAAANTVRRWAIDAIKEFASFDQKMSQSLAIMGDVNDAVRQRMVQTAKRTAVDVNIADDRMAEGFYFLASAGQTAEQSITSLPVAARFAKAGVFDLATATEMLTVSQSALGLSMDDPIENMRQMTRVSDVLAKANVLTNGSVQQLAESLQNRAAATMRQFNIEVEEGVAVLAAYAKQGTTGQRAGEEFTRFVTRLTSEFNQNRAAFDKLRIDIYDPKDKNRLLPLADILEQITDRLKPMSIAQRTATMEAMGFHAEAAGAIRPLMGMSDTIRDFQKALEGASGATADLANRQMTSLTERGGQLAEKFRQLKQEVGETLVDGMSEANESVIDANESLAAMKELTDILKPSLHDAAGGISVLTQAAALLATGLVVGLMTGLNVVANFLVGTLKTATAIGAEGIGLIVGAIGQLNLVMAGILSLGGRVDNPVAKFFRGIGDEATAAATKILNFGKSTQASAMGNFTLEDMRPADPEQDPEFLATADRARKALRDRRHGRAPTAAPPAAPPPGGGGGTVDVPLTKEQETALREAAERRRDFLRDLTLRVAKEASNAFGAAIAEIDRLEKKAHDVFGKTLPDEVANGLNKMRIAAVQDEQLRKRKDEFGLIRDEPVAKPQDTRRFDERVAALRAEQRQVERNSTLWKAYERQIEGVRNEQQRSNVAVGVSASTSLEHITRFIATLRDEQQQLEQNSKQWNEYQELIQAAMKEQQSAQVQVADQSAAAAERTAEAWQNTVDAMSAQGADLENSFVNVAFGISDAFGTAFGLIFRDGLTLGRFAVTLGRQIGAALVGGVAQYAGMKVGQNIAEAFEMHAKAIAATAEGFLNMNPAAFAAAAMFEAAAAQHVVSAAKWAVISGAAGASAAALSSGGGGGGGGGRGGAEAPDNARDIGGDQAQNAEKGQPTFIVYVDAFDPKNPAHQEVIYAGMREATERIGVDPTFVSRGS